jgi:hypothetical protein
MKKVTIAVGLTVAAASAFLLTGCHANLVGSTAAGSTTPQSTHQTSAASPKPTTHAGAEPTAGPTTPTTPTTPKTPTAQAAKPSVVAPSVSTPVIATPSAAKAGPARSGRPPQPAAPTTSSDRVAGLTAAISRTAHPGLGICGNAYSSVIAASGDLRGIGGAQYLVDTTCQGATGSSPDEVAIFQSVGGALTRTAVLYQPSAGAPVATSYPYMDGPHTVVLTYNYGAEYRLDSIGASSISVGPIQRS